MIIYKTISQIWLQNRYENKFVKELFLATCENLMKNIDDLEILKKTFDE